MKKIYLLIFLAFSANTLFAQIPFQNLSINRIENSEIQKAKRFGAATEKTASETPLYIDYSVANFDDNFYVWQFNSDFIASDTNLNYVAVGLDSISGYTDLADPTGTLIDLDFPNVIRIDSIFAVVSHENNSGNYDYITMQIVTLNASGVPTANVLWEQKDSSNFTLSPGGNWLGADAGVLLSYAPDYTTSWDQKVGLVLKYNDPSKTDTFSISAGYFATDTNAAVATQSNFKNSYMRYPPFIPGITPCSNVGYGNPVGSSGWFEAQNWSIWAYVTSDPVGINERTVNGLSVNQNIPNPATGKTTINYELSTNENISFELVDMQGRKVLFYNEGLKSAGKHSIEVQTNQLDAGTYFYSLITNNGRLTKKMIVVK